MRKLIWEAVGQRERIIQKRIVQFLQPVLGYPHIVSAEKFLIGHDRKI